MINRKRKGCAFTLLELLVAMVLMNVLAASLYASLYIGFKARESSKAAVQPIRAAQIAMELLQQDIASSLPPTGILAGEFDGVDERDGNGRDCDNLLFYSSNHKPEQEETACDIRKIELALVTSTVPDESVLVRRIETNLLSPKSLEPVEEVLCRRVLSFNLRYFDGFDWWDEWNSVSNNDTLPRAVEISLEIECDQEDKTAEHTSYQLTCAFIIPCSSSVEQGGEAVQRTGSPDEE